MTQAELFDLPETLSPLEVWKRRHGIQWEYSYARKEFYAWSCRGRVDVCSCSRANYCGGQYLGTGETAEAAMLDWAKQNGVPGWLEEAYLPAGGAV